MEIKKTKGKKVWSLILTLVMVIQLLPPMTIPVQAANEVYGVLKSDKLVYETNVDNTKTDGVAIDRKTVTHLFVADNVTEIGDNAFMWCSNLTTIDLPSVISIGSHAFDQCTKLTAINLPAVTSVGDYAFSQCSELTTVNLPAVTSVGDHVFYFCGKLTRVSLPEAASIGIQAFFDCQNLTTVDLPKVTSIPNNAFSYCSSLTIDLSKVTSIGSEAFFNCQKLTTVDLSALTSISGSAFLGCTSLVEVYMPKVTSIGSHAFDHCTKLTAINLPAVTSVGDSAFLWCSGLTTVNIPMVKSIGVHAFFECSTLANLTVGVIPPTSVVIGAFYNCPRTTLTIAGGNTLEAVAAYNAVDDGDPREGYWYGWVLPIPVTSIKFDANDGTGTMSPQQISDGSSQPLNENTFTREGFSFKNWNTDKDGGGTAYENKAEFKAVAVTSDTTLYAQWSENTPAEPGYGVLRSNRLVYATNKDNTKTDGVAIAKKTVTHLFAAADVTEIDDEAFKDCENLVEVNIPKVMTIGNTVFDGCSRLTTIKMPAVTSIGNHAFYGCSNLNEVDLPEVTLIGNSAFGGCSGLITIKMPMIRTINNNAFYNCSELVNIDMSAATKIDNDAFGSCIKLTTINLPVIELIGERVFSDCKGLTTVNIPMVTSIGVSAFSECSSLANLTVGVTPPISVGIEAFNNCPKTTLTIAGGNTLEAVAAYNAVDDGDPREGYWYGWVLPIPVTSIKFDANDGTGTMSPQQISDGSSQPLNENTFTREGFSFKNWNTDKDGGGTAYENKAEFNAAAITSETILYAQWSENTYTITGRVEDGNTVAIADAKVELKKGDTVIGAAVTTAADGSFSFNQVPNGSYDLIVSKGDGRVTISVTVDNADNRLASAIILPSGKMNSEVEVKGDTPPITVGNLDQQFDEKDKKIVANGGSVEIKLIAETKDSTAKNAANVTVAAASNGKEIGMFIDLSVFKIIGASTKKLNELPSLIDIYIPLNEALQGKTDYVIYRYHDSVVDMITTTSNEQGEKIEIIDGGKTIKLSAKKFSTYAIAYNDTTTGGGGTPSNYSEIEKLIIALPAVENFKESNLPEFEKVEIEYNKLNSAEKLAIDETLHNKYKDILKLAQTMRKDSEKTQISSSKNPKTGNNSSLIPISVTMGLIVLGLGLYKKAKKKQCE